MWSACSCTGTPCTVLCGYCDGRTNTLSLRVTGLQAGQVADVCPLRRPVDPDLNTDIRTRVHRNNRAVNNGFKDNGRCREVGRARRGEVQTGVQLRLGACGRSHERSASGANGCVAAVVHPANASGTMPTTRTRSTRFTATIVREGVVEHLAGQLAGCTQSSDSDRPAQTITCTGDIDVCAMPRSHRYWNVHEGVLGDIVACTCRSVDAVAVSLAPARGNPKASECSSKPAVHVTDGAVVPPGHTNPGGHGVADRDSDELLHTKSAATSAVQTVTRSSRYGKESSVRNTP